LRRISHLVFRPLGIPARKGRGRLRKLSTRRFHEKDGLLYLDPGPYVKALEYATGKEALILGKPSRDFFLSAVSDMGILPSEAAVIGDDIETDVRGGMEAGLKGILVKTGKFRRSDLEKNIHPDFILKI